MIKVMHILACAPVDDDSCFNDNIRLFNFHELTWSDT